MSTRDLAAFRAAALNALAEAGATACADGDCETALRRVTLAAMTLLGDREAHLRPGALKPGERQFFVAGLFMLTPDRRQHLLLAEQGFPAEQRRLRIDVDLGHPGWVYRNRKPLILANTDEAPDFRQILKTARMGSALYAPLFWRGEYIGQLITAAQARNTFSEADLEALCAFAPLAAALFQAHDGARLLRESAP